jgi:hypothetical protein
MNVLTARFEYRRHSTHDRTYRHNSEWRNYETRNENVHNQLYFLTTSRQGCSGSCANTLHGYLLPFKKKEQYQNFISLRTGWCSGLLETLNYGCGGKYCPSLICSYFFMNVTHLLLSFPITWALPHFGAFISYLDYEFALHSVELCSIFSVTSTQTSSSRLRSKWTL